MRRLTLLGCAFAILLGGFGFVSEASAEQLVVRRHVTIREGPARTTRRIIFPEIGDRFELLDEGARRSGYYHIRLPDGREGWIYYSYVRREPDATGEPLVPPSGNAMAVHYINVDQGNAALLEFPCGAILIDAGGWGNPDTRRDDSGPIGDHLIAYLNAFFARRPDLHRRLDMVFVTHEHVDHNRYLRRVVQSFAIGRYVHNGSLNPYGTGAYNARWMVGLGNTPAPPIPVRAVTEPDVEAGDARDAEGRVITPAALDVDDVTCPGVDPRIRVLAGGRPTNPGWTQTDYGNENNHSLAIRVDYGEASFLFTGDMETRAMRALVERLGRTDLLDVDVWLIGHHGAENGITPPFVAAVTPEIAVISMGTPVSHEDWTAWKYGHPRLFAVNLLEQNVSGTATPRTVQVGVGVGRFEPFAITRAIYATGWDGDIVINASSVGIQRVQVAH